MNPTTLTLVAEPLIRQALTEDITSEDVSTASVMPEAHQAQVQLIAKQDGVICGLDVFERTFQILDPAAHFEANVHDGDEVSSGDVLGQLFADARAMLSGERVALNYLQRMSGVATATRRMVALLKDTSITLVDTRKTTPNMRVFEKEAVRIGGGTNHRYNLSDAVMLKDNHLDAAGSITAAVNAARTHVSFTCKIEVECETLNAVQEALNAGADIIMLDNMDVQTMQEALALIDHKAQTEISGNVDEAKIASIKDLDVDFISSGSLTHSAGILDLSMKHLTLID